MRSTIETVHEYVVSLRKRKLRGCITLQDNTLFIGAAAAAAGLAALYFASTSKAGGQTSVWEGFSRPARNDLKEQATGSDEPPSDPSAQAGVEQLSCQLEDEQQTKQIQQPGHKSTEAQMTGKPVASSARSSKQLAANGESVPHAMQQQAGAKQAQLEHTEPLLQQQKQEQRQEQDVVIAQHKLQHNAVDLTQQEQKQDTSPAAWHRNVAVDAAAAAAPEHTPAATAEQQQLQPRQLERQSSSFKQQLSEWELRVSSPTAAAGGDTSHRHPTLSLSPPAQAQAQQQQQQQQNTSSTAQQQRQEAAHPPQPPMLSTPTRRASVDSSWSTCSSTPATPNFAGFHGSSSSSMKQHTPINATRKGPSLDITVSSSAVARSLQMQYIDDTAAAAEGSIGPVRPLATACAVLCEQHCKKLQDISGELGETTALDIGCGTGGSCFQLALSFSHVLGIDGDPLHVMAAKKMKERGQLEYHPQLDGGTSCAAAAAADGGGGISSSSSTGARRVSEADRWHMHHAGTSCLAAVSEDIDRDKVRFWSYPLPDLPPKLQPVDAVLVEDVTGRLGGGLARVLQQIPSLLNPQGVCVVVLDGSSSRSSSVNGDGTMSAAAPAAATAEAAAVAGTADTVHSLEQVKRALQHQGLRFLKEQRFQYPVAGTTELGAAHAGVWMQA